MMPCATSGNSRPVGTFGKTGSPGAPTGSCVSRQTMGSFDEDLFACIGGFGRVDCFGRGTRASRSPANGANAAVAAGKSAARGDRTRARHHRQGRGRRDTTAGCRSRNECQASGERAAVDARGSCPGHTRWQSERDPEIADHDRRAAMADLPRCRAAVAGDDGCSAAATGPRGAGTARNRRGTAPGRIGRGALIVSDPVTLARMPRRGKCWRGLFRRQHQDHGFVNRARNNGSYDVARVGRTRA